MRFRPRKPKFRRPASEYTINEEILASEMRVIDEKGQQVGVLTRAVALQMAQEQGKDLVLIADQAKPPVVKLIDVSKHKYQDQQRKQEVRKLSKPADIKEVRLSPFIASGDLESRTNRVREWINDGDKVRLLLRFKGREITKKEFGENVLRKVYESVKEIATIETEPKLQGKMMTMQLMPSTKKKVTAAESDESKE